MGCWDSYCALCGGPQQCRYSEPKYAEKLDWESSCFQWLLKIRVAGTAEDDEEEGNQGLGDEELPRAFKRIESGFVSGTGDGRYSGEGSAHVPALYSAAVNLDASDEEEDRVPRYELSIYEDDGKVVMHAACWEILRSALRWTAPNANPSAMGTSSKSNGEDRGTVDGIRLGTIMATICAHDTARITGDWFSVGTDIPWAFDTRYKFVKNLQGQSWEGGKAEDWLCVDPYLDITPLIEQFRENKDARPSVHTQDSRGKDAFGMLPPELLVKIMELLVTDDVFTLRIASRAAAVVVLRRGFWRRRDEMGCVFELEGEKISDVDWEGTCEALTRYKKESLRKALQASSSRWSQGGTPRGKRPRPVYAVEDTMEKQESDSKRLAKEVWQNRSRIWDLCLGVAKECWERKMKNSVAE